jgi:hypothetical protein
VKGLCSSFQIGASLIFQNSNSLKWKTAILLHKWAFLVFACVGSVNTEQFSYKKSESLQNEFQYTVNAKQIFSMLSQHSNFDSLYEHLNACSASTERISLQIESIKHRTNFIAYWVTNE